jgi:hypothetical protein
VEVVANSVVLLAVPAGARISVRVVLRLGAREHSLLAWLGTVRVHHLPRLYGYVRLLHFY